MLIDSTWGAGQPASEQRYVFDTFWNKIDQEWAGFPNLDLNWDSLANLYRPQIGSGLSRGRFYGLMSRMWTSLTELHTYISDPKVNLAFNDNPFQYRRGVPLLCMAPVRGSLLGAAVTPLPDSTNLVFRAAPGNPLGLEPGDLILGYEGIPWGRLFPRLIDAGLPINNAPFLPGSTWGSTPESASHFALMSVACNWGLFDTIDVVKYSSGDTLHLSTAPLVGYTELLPQSDQVGVAGVPLPVAPGGPNAVSWGVVQGTNIGYIHVWDWYSAETQNLFSAAVSDLCETKKVVGLVLDFRMNWGGSTSIANGGFSQLFNFDPTVHLSIARRNNVNDHSGFSFSPPTSGFAPAATAFDRPIAALIGPGCVSAGDINAFRLRFHPMVRLFGRPTNGALVGGSYSSATISDGWEYHFPTAVSYSTVPGEGFLIHKGVQPDEQVWLTRDGVAKGEDDVVKRALAWITTLTYAHNCALDRAYARPGLDSVRVTATLANPLHHAIAVSAIVTDVGGSVRDSVAFYDDGLHGDGSAGDSVWGCQFRAPSDEGVFDISSRTDDITEGTMRRLPRVIRFATAGPVTLDSIAFGKSGPNYGVRLYLKNEGSSFAIGGATARLWSNDPWVKSVTQTAHSLPTIGPGEIKTPALLYTVAFDTVSFPGYFNLKVDVAIGGLSLWVDSTRLQITGVASEERLPTVFALEQNYPNPFNPSTTIRYGLPHKVNVSLTVYNTLGQQVGVLQNGEQEAGYHEVRFDGKNLSSGVYFYRIQAGDFTQTKRLMLLR